MPQFCIIVLGILILAAQALTYRKVRAIDVDEFILGMRVGEKRANPDDVVNAYRLGRKHGATDIDDGSPTSVERPTVIPLPDDEGSAWERHDDPRA